jgi:large subunit ribosomal protein L7/L12
MAVNASELIEQIKGMTVLELNTLVEAIQAEFGVVAAVGGGGGGATAAAVEVVEQSEFNVILESAGDKKIQVIKVIREITGLGLKEAKEIADAAPKAVKEGVGKDEAEKLKTMLEAEGAKVTLK